MHSTIIDLLVGLRMKEGTSLESHKGEQGQRLLLWSHRNNFGKKSLFK